MNAPKSEEFRVERLDAQHNREDFACGIQELDAYLQTQARQESDRGAATVYVLVPSANPAEIAGFYTLSATGVTLEHLPPDVIKRLPRYPLVPATLLGRFAISQTCQGRRLGEFLLLDVLSRSLEASKRVGSAAVIVDAKDERGATFYERYGFRRFPDRPLRLFIPMKTIARLPR